ncbi:hypothetical protein Agub_g6158 [Astrephomene gubernaculifera]|uniref:Ankyrin repeat domain-containing protein n=1 Tax=Astrephomene gubernaculifera TaxID=47775 RepID=A0AAD3DMW7_9CHLO|nr:hypothetical protein Agub_g6158 [Astrephomene gubernaculifera]
MSSTWPQLPPEIVEHIARFLPVNDVSCNLRLVNKAAAAQFRGPRYATVRLSLTSPHDAFAHRWGAPGAMRCLTYNQRLKLVCLTARTGNLRNLSLALACAGLAPSAKFLEAAAAGGQLDAVLRLRELGCPLGNALKEAAEAGQRRMCEWLLANGCQWTISTVCAAARGGHPALMDWLWQLRAGHACEASNSIHRLIDACKGCDLPTMRRIFHSLTKEESDWFLGYIVFLYRHVMIGAGGSSTPDWQAKIEWLEALAAGLPKDHAACHGAAFHPDALPRLIWLRQRGHPFGETVALGAAAAGNVAALTYLLDEGGVQPDADLTHRATARGHLGVLQMLHARGALAPEGVDWRGMAGEGHLGVMAWLVEEVGLRLPASVPVHAARSGSLPLLSWLHERGVAWSCEAFNEAAGAGSEEAVEWLLAAGCPMSMDGKAYDKAAANGDYAMLRCLRRLGCPWGTASPHTTFSSCVLSGCPLQVLGWLAAEGCPVDWGAAVAAAEWRVRDSPGEASAGVLAWVQQGGRQQRFG